VALDATLKVAVIWVLLATVTPVAVTPDPEILIVAGVERFAPVSVTGVLLFTEADDGLIEVNVGVGCATVKVTVPLVPLFVFTVTLRPPSVAPLAIWKVAVACVELLIVTPEGVTPVPEMLIVRGETKFVPISVTGTLAPGAPEEGLMEERVGVKLGGGGGDEFPSRVLIRVAPFGLPQPVTKSKPMAAFQPLLPLVMSWKLA